MKKNMQYLYGILVIAVIGWMVFVRNDGGAPVTAAVKANSEDIQQYHRIVQRDNHPEATLVIKMPAGELTVESQSAYALEVDIKHDPELEMPVLSTLTKANQGLEISLLQDGEGNISLRNKRNSVVNQWRLDTSPNIPYSYEFSIGAGKLDVNLSGSHVQRFHLKTGAASADINLSNSMISDLTIEAGVGSVSIDLSGSRLNNTDGKIRGGVGSLTLFVPKDVGVRFRASGLGGVTATGFSRVDGFYENEHWGKTMHQITFDISAGIGSVNVYSK